MSCNVQAIFGWREILRVCLVFMSFCVNSHEGVCRKFNLGNLFGVKMLVSMNSILVVRMINIFNQSCRNYDQIYSVVCLFTEC